MANINYTDDLRGRIQGLAKNAIINSDFNIWQRGTSFAAIGSAVYSSDRWIYAKVGTMVHTISRDTDVPTQAQSGHLSNYSLKADVTTADASIAAGDVIAIYQRIEGYNFAPFQGKTANLSFWVKATKTGIYCISFRNGSVNRSYISEYTVNSSDVWEKKTITVDFSDSGSPWDYTNGVGVDVIFTLACGSTFQTTADAWQAGNYLATSNQVNSCDNVVNNFRLAQVQFELGDAATDFEYRDIATELYLCKRYYQQSGGDNINQIYTHTYIGAGGQVTGSYQYPVEMRVVPTMTKVGTFTVSNANQPAVTGNGKNGFSWWTSGLALGVASVQSTTTAYFTSDAEL